MVEIVDWHDWELEGIEVYLAPIGLTDAQSQSVRRNLRGPRGAEEKLFNLDFSAYSFCYEWTAAH